MEAPVDVGAKLLACEAEGAGLSSILGLTDVTLGQLFCYILFLRGGQVFADKAVTCTPQFHTGLFITYHPNVFPMESRDSRGAYVVMDVFLLSRALSHSVICMNLLCSPVIKSNLQLVRFSFLTGGTLIFIILCLVPGNE